MIRSSLSSRERQSFYISCKYLSPIIGATACIHIFHHRHAKAAMIDNNLDRDAFEQWLLIKSVFKVLWATLQDEWKVKSLLTDDAGSKTTKRFLSNWCKLFFPRLIDTCRGYERPRPTSQWTLWGKLWSVRQGYASLCVLSNFVLFF